ncbi:uncharacterized protein F5Z01DRAFT_390102 [Emericellopsis atlantica]|uniref:Uncharacterized protein n=1 Tax=Emericellopsis atlantica TaxID=2614577 RepID=A0A9P8CS57_9HYPO|nr:uncharacterized protein F5Z01DRAFT_390102 [Emericellopsis atlantica]KAG9257458.1 hypothetical protein F5Z01DRAFT_390102 [Emericellopsis atlantica]
MAPNDELHGPAGGVPLGGQVMSVIVSLAAVTVLTLFLTKRFLVIRTWRRLPFVVWLVFAIYVDSYAFVVATAIIQHALGVNSNILICRGAILLCLACYVTTKILIYLFLVEKAYIIRGTTKPRMRSRLYLFNSFGMISVYIVVVTMNFIFRITRMDENGQCIIGMEKLAMIPLITFDAIVNVYLTIIFLIPLKNLYTFKNMPRTAANLRLRTVAFRTFFGAASTLLSSITNLTVLMVLNGEPGWVCLMLCNCDILFSAMVIQWVTSKDNAGTSGHDSLTADNSAARRGRIVDAVRRTGFASETICARCTPPSSPAEIALVPSVATTYSKDSSDMADLKLENHVLITTTIQRESRPNDEGPCQRLSSMSEDHGLPRHHHFDNDAVGADSVARDAPGYRGSRRMSCGPQGSDGYVTSRTMITGGQHGNDQGESPC